MYIYISLYVYIDIHISDIYISFLYVYSNTHAYYNMHVEMYLYIHIRNMYINIHTFPSTFLGTASALRVVVSRYFGVQNEGVHGLRCSKLNPQICISLSLARSLSHTHIHTPNRHTLSFFACTGNPPRLTCSYFVTDHQDEIR